MSSIVGGKGAAMRWFAGLIVTTAFVAACDTARRLNGSGSPLAIRSAAQMPMGEVQLLPSCT